MKKLLSICVVLCCWFLGCGSPSGSTTDLATVFLTVSPTSDRLEVDVLTGNSCSTGVSVGGTYTTQTIPITVTSTPYANATQKSPVTIDSISISYSKYGSVSSPSIPVQYDTGTTINPSVPTVFNVKVATDKLNFDMVNTYRNLTNQSLNLCSSDYWEYYATITFNGIENYSKKSVTFSTVVKVAFADRGV